jgi:hypothetical protein
MTRKIIHRALRISRGLAFAAGAVVICAVVLGAATVALAAAPGDPFRLGKGNVINAVTKLVGKANSPRLVIDNNGNGVALSLQVKPGKPPMQVNSTRKVARLNADRLDNKNASDFYAAGSKVADSDKLDGLDEGAFLRKDGKATDADRLDGKDSGDFLSASTYTIRVATTGSGGANQRSDKDLSCNFGDRLLSGGYYSVDEGTHVEGSTPDGISSWIVFWKNDATVDTIFIKVLCADTTP